MKMKIPIHIQLSNIEIIVTPVKRPIKDIVGFVEIEITDEEGALFKVRGYTIKVKKFDDSTVFTVNAPAFKSGFAYRTSFVVESKSLWDDIKNAILDEFSEKTGGLNPEDFLANEDVSPDEIHPERVQ